MEKAEAKPDWVKMKPDELEKLVVDLCKQGNSPAKIGLVLRDKHAIPKAKLLGKKITDIIKENKLKIPAEKEQVGEKIQKLEKHIIQHKHDTSAKRAAEKKLWIMHKLKKQEKLASQNLAG